MFFIRVKFGFGFLISDYNWLKRRRFAGIFLFGPVPSFPFHTIMILFSRFFYFISGMVRIYLGRMNFVWVTLTWKENAEFLCLSFF